MNKIYIYDEIGWAGIYPDMIMRELEFANGADIEVRMNTPGGDVFDGLTIYNMLKNYAGNVSIVVDGLAASIGSIIALAGDSLTMNEGAFMMIHNPWSGLMGESKDMRQKADMMDKIKEQMIAIYKANSGMDEETISKMMDEETWMAADEMETLGFSISKAEGLKIAANLHFKEKTKYLFNNTPEEVLNMSKKIKAEVEEIEKPMEEVAPEVTPEAVQVEETTEEEIVAEVEEPTAEEEIQEEEFAELEVVAKYTEEQVQEMIQAALKAESDRQNAIKALAFDGQSDLVDELISEKVSLKDAAERIINHAKQNQLFMKKENSEASLKDQLKAAAPAAMVTHEETTGESEIKRLRAALDKEMNPKARLEISKQILQLKKAAGTK